MKRLAAIVCATTLSVAALAGCGSDDGGGDSENASGDDYCGQIEDAQNDFSDLAAEDTTVEDIEALGDRMGDIADAAPADIQPKWQSGADASASMVKALEDAGVDTSKPVAELAQDPNAQKAMMSVQADAQSLTEDQQAIAEQVKKECDIDMGASQ